MRRPDLKGVGGWLLFFCVSLTVLAPALMLIRTWGGGFELDSMIDLAFTAFGVFVGIMVWSTNQSALLLLWIYFGLAAALLLLGLVGTLVSEQPDPQLLGQLFRGLLSTVLWFAYFKKSDRVQATFGRNL